MMSNLSSQITQESLLKDGVQPFSLKPSTTQQSTELKSHQHLKQRDLPQLI
jgi:hypothetical protein